MYFFLDKSENNKQICGNNFFKTPHLYAPPCLLRCSLTRSGSIWSRICFLTLVSPSWMKQVWITAVCCFSCLSLCSPLWLRIIWARSVWILVKQKHAHQSFEQRLPGNKGSTVNAITWIRKGRLHQRLVYYDQLRLPQAVATTAASFGYCSRGLQNLGMTQSKWCSSGMLLLK